MSTVRGHITPGTLPTSGVSTAALRRYANLNAFQARVRQGTKCIVPLRYIHTIFPPPWQVETRPDGTNAQSHAPWGGVTASTAVLDARRWSFARESRQRRAAAVPLAGTLRVAKFSGEERMTHGRDAMLRILGQADHRLVVLQYFGCDVPAVGGGRGHQNEAPALSLCAFREGLCDETFEGGRLQ